MIAVCVPTHRKKLYEGTFLPAWKDLFEKHKVTLLTTRDAPKAEDIELLGYGKAKKIMGRDVDLIYPRNAGHKLLAFYYIAKHLPEIEYIVCLDDDVTPIGDPIQDHISALNKRVPINWMSIANLYTRGVPYGVRDEAEVVLSHGVWDGVPDIDSPTQLLIGDKPHVEYRQMPIPKGVLYPMSEMNIAFKRKLLPYMYFAPTCDGFYGGDDIWAGIESKRAIDKKGWAAVTGYSMVYHERASDVFEILIKHGKFIKYNERYWKGKDLDDPYFKMYKQKKIKVGKADEETIMRTLSLDIHDFSIMVNRFDLLLTLKEHYPEMKVSLFTIPYDFGYEMSPSQIFREDSLRKINQNKDWLEFIPHGLIHFEKEFEKADKETVEMYIENVIPEMIALGYPGDRIVEGFCAPNWLWNQAVIDVLNKNKWWGAVDRNQPEMLRPKRYYEYSHSIHEPFWLSNQNLIKLHGHMTLPSPNNLEDCLLKLFKIPQDVKWSFASELVEGDK